MTERLLTVAEIARQLRTPDQRIYFLLREGALEADAVAGRSFLFQATSIARIRAALRSGLHSKKFHNLARLQGLRSGRDSAEKSECIAHHTPGGAPSFPRLLK